MKIFVAPVLVLLLEISVLLRCIPLVCQPHPVLELPRIEYSLTIVIYSPHRGHGCFFLEFGRIRIDECIENAVYVIAKDAKSQDHGDE